VICQDNGKWGLMNGGRTTTNKGVPEVSESSTDEFHSTSEWYQIIVDNILPYARK